MLPPRHTSSVRMPATLRAGAPAALRSSRSFGHFSSTMGATETPVSAATRGAASASQSVTVCASAAPADATATA